MEWMVSVANDPEVDALSDPVPDVDNGVIPEILNGIVKKDRKRKWVVGKELRLDGRAWRPSATNAHDEVLHVTALGTLPRWVDRRLRAAARQRTVYVALPLSALYTREWRRLLVSTDAFVYVIDDDNERLRTKRRHVLAALADLQIPVSPDERIALASSTLDNLDAGTAQLKGARLEALLAFLFGQVSDFRVVHRNYRNRTQEIDLVLQLDGYSSRIWHIPGTPLLLVEAKNRGEKADPATYSVFLNKMRTKRNNVRYGFLVATAGFSEDARRESLRYSTGKHCIVMLGPSELRTLVEARDIDSALEGLVRAAVLD